MIIRQEQKEDHKAVFDLIEAAFREMEKSDGTEHFLVERLRKSDAFIPELSLVALIDDSIVGHILLSKVTIQNGDKMYSSLSLAPLSVHPDYHNKGIGTALMKEADRNAIAMDYTSVLLVGHPKYYPRFGYRPMHDFNISVPFDSPPEACMIKELRENGLQHVEGNVIYPQEFFQ